MADLPLILVIGGTGAQGGPVVEGKWAGMSQDVGKEARLLLHGVSRSKVVCRESGQSPDDAAYITIT